MNHKLVTTLLADASAWRIEELKGETATEEEAAGQLAQQQ
jgi:hypothetical protein